MIIRVNIILIVNELVSYIIVSKRGEIICNLFSNYLKINNNFGEGIDITEGNIILNIG